MLLHVHNGESSENTYLVNCQLCYRSQGCPSIVNNVVKATLSSKQRSEGFGKGKKDDGVNEKHHCPFPSDFLVVHVKRWLCCETNCMHVRELTIIDNVLCMAY